MTGHRWDPDALPTGQRDLFAVPAEVAYFNTANLAPQLTSVRVAGERALERRSRPWTITAEDWFTDVEQLRGLFGGLIGADAEGIALVPATSYGFAVAARNIQLKAGDSVLVLAGEYPSGIYTWRAAVRAAGADIRTVNRTGELTWTEALLQVLDERVTVVSVPNVHWTDGAILDLPAISDRTRESAPGWSDEDQHGRGWHMDGTNRAGTTRGVPNAAPSALPRRSSAPPTAIRSGPGHGPPDSPPRAPRDARRLKANMAAGMFYSQPDARFAAESDVARPESARLSVRLRRSA